MLQAVLSNWILGPLAIGVIALAALIWLARRRIASRRELESRAQELATLASAGRAIARSQLDDVDALCSLIYQQASQFVDTTTFQIGLFEENRYEIRYWLRDGERLPPEQFDLSQAGGLIGWMRLSRQSILVRDFERELDALPARPRYLSEHPPRSAVFVPIAAGDQAIGVIAIQNNRPGAFGEEHVRLLSIIANQAGPVIANARLVQSERRRADQLQLIGEVSRQVAAILDLDVLFDRVVELIQTHFRYYFVAVVLRQEETDQLTFTSATSRAILGRRVQIGQGVIGKVVETGNPLLVSDVASDANYVSMAALPETRSELAVPLIFGKNLLGVLDVESTEVNAFTQEDVFILRTLADQVAIAAHEARLYAAEREQAWISTALLQVSEATVQSSSLDEVLDTVTRITPMLSGVDRCGILLWDPVLEEYRAAASYGLNERTDAFRAVRTGASQWTDLEETREGEGLLMLDAADLRLREAFGSGPVLALPLYARGELAGVMLLGSPEGSQLPLRKAALVAGIANQAALAIESAQLLAAQREEAWVNMALLQVAEAVGSQTELHDILTTVVRLTPLLVGVEACLIFLYDKTHAEYFGSDAYGLARERLAMFKSITAPHTMWFSQDGHVAVPPSIVDVLGLRAPMALGLQAKGDVVGIMVIDGDADSLALSARRSNILAGIASQVAMAVVNARLAEESAARQRLERELSLARQIQESFLPDRRPSLPGWQIAAFWRSARQVGGDFYDFIPIRDEFGRMGVAIADVADKGVPAALFMALCRTLLRAVAIIGRSPAETLRRANDLILSDARSDLFVTIFYLTIEPSSGRIAFANAGHNPPLLVRASAAPSERLDRHGVALGVLPGIPLLDQVVEAQPGDVLVLYTDGVTEALNDSSEEFGLERLEQCIIRHQRESADNLAEAIQAALRQHVGDEPPFDDITLVVVKRVA